jgi:RNA polymerase sigma-70 factor (ECF subfamily)
MGQARSGSTWEQPRVTARLVPTAFPLPFGAYNQPGMDSSGQFDSRAGVGARPERFGAQDESDPQTADVPEDSVLVGEALTRDAERGQAGKPQKADEDPEVQPDAQSDAQPLDEVRVEEDMSTAAYDRNWAGVTRDLVSGARPSNLPDDGSDAAIMLHVREGDDSGFIYLIEKYRRQMIHYMFRMTGNQAVAEELAQEVFLRVYRSRESYRAEAKFTTWLYRIATNLGVNYARDHKHEKAAQNIYLDQPDAETGTTPDVADSRLTAEQNLMRNERLAGIRAQVMALPERQREAVLMHKYQEMDYREIGAVLKLSESATKSLLFRAYQTLRERLKDYV